MWLFAFSEMKFKCEFNSNVDSVFYKDMFIIFYPTWSGIFFNCAWSAIKVIIIFL